MTAADADVELSPVGPKEETSTEIATAPSSTTTLEGDVEEGNSSNNNGGHLGIDDEKDGNIDAVVDGGG